jgi:hypothetical protein
VGQRSQDCLLGRSGGVVDATIAISVLITIVAVAVVVVVHYYNCVAYAEES